MRTLMDLDHDLSLVEQQMAAGQSLIVSIQSELEAIEASAATLPAEFAGIKSRLANLETCCEGTDSAIADLQSGASTVQQTINNIQATISTMQSTIADLPEDVEALTRSLGAATGNITTLQNSVSGLQNSIGGLQSTVAAIQTAQNTANGKISAAETKIAGIETQYAAQQTEINAIKATNVNQSATLSQHTSAINTLNGKHTDSGWVTLPLQNGVQNYNAAQSCQCRKIGNQVFLRGVYKSATTIPMIIATLPVGFRPSRRILLNATRGHIEYDRLEIETGGQIALAATSNIPTNSDAQWHSLELISFLVD